MSKVQLSIPVAHRRRSGTTVKHVGEEDVVMVEIKNHLRQRQQLYLKVLILS